MPSTNLTTLRANNRKRYQRRLAKGLCGSCGKVPHRPDRVTCAACGKRESDRETRRQRFLDPIQKKLGICRHCDSRQAIPGRRICGYCLELRSEASARYRQRRREQNLCLRCGAAPAEEGRKHCRPCADKCAANQRRYRLARNSKGTCCDCLKPAAPGRKRCKACLVKQRAEQKALRAAKAKEHRCYRCGTPTDGRHARCEACLVKAREWFRNHRSNRKPRPDEGAA